MTKTLDRFGSGWRFFVFFFVFCGASSFLSLFSLGAPENGKPPIRFLSRGSVWIGGSALRGVFPFTLNNSPTWGYLIYEDLR